MIFSHKYCSRKKLIPSSPNLRSSLAASAFPTFGQLTPKKIKIRSNQHNNFWAWKCSRNLTNTPRCFSSKHRGDLGITCKKRTKVPRNSLCKSWWWWTARPWRTKCTLWLTATKSSFNSNCKTWVTALWFKLWIFLHQFCTITQKLNRNFTKWPMPAFPMRCATPSTPYHRLIK